MQTCPKCRHVHGADDAALDWQCPACGAAIKKSGVKTAQRKSWPWGWIWGAAIVVLLAWSALDSGDAASQEDVAVHLSPAEMRTLVAGVKSSDVVMYTLTDCSACHQAKAWMALQGFAYTECNLDVDARCEGELKQHEAMAVPFLLVRGQPMDVGFDGDEFLTLLQQQAKAM